MLKFWSAIPSTLIFSLACTKLAGCLSIQGRFLLLLIDDIWIPRFFVSIILFWLIWASFASYWHPCKRFLYSLFHQLSFILVKLLIFVYIDSWLLHENLEPLCLYPISYFRSLFSKGSNELISLSKIAALILKDLDNSLLNCLLGTTDVLFNL